MSCQAKFAFRKQSFNGKLANFGIFAGDMDMDRCCEMTSRGYTDIVLFRGQSRSSEVNAAPTHNGVRISVAGTAQRPESVSGRRGPCPVSQAR